MITIVMVGGPKGRYLNRLDPKVALFICNAVLIKQRFEFCGEPPASMMLFLIVDVFRYLCLRRFTYRECRVTFLPFKTF